MPRHTRTHTLQSLLAAAALLLGLGTNASANHISTTSRTIKATWRSWEFIPPIGETFRCPVTLEGSLHSSTIAKVVGALLGFITRASINSSACAGIHATILQASLPWHMRYRGFTGTLPSITRIETGIIGLAFLIEGTFGIECLYISSTTEPTIVNYNVSAAHAITSVEVAGEINSTTGCGIFGEHIRGKLAGESTAISQLGNTAGITVTLI